MMIVMKKIMRRTLHANLQSTKDKDLDTYVNITNIKNECKPSQPNSKVLKMNSLGFVGH